jgi:chemotaxis response regulator CheB
MGLTGSNPLGWKTPLADMCVRREVVRTLVVEDDSFWQETILRKLQEQRSLQVIAIVADGLEAVRNAEELQPDLVLLDPALSRWAS